MPMEETTKTRKVIVVGTPTDKFDIPFDYLAKKFVKVYQEGILLEALVDYDFITSTRIQMLKGEVATGQTIEIRRETSATARLVSFRDASVLTASDLDISALQSLHLSEEARDSGLWAEYAASVVREAAEAAAAEASAAADGAIGAANEAVDALGGIQQLMAPLEFVGDYREGLVLNKPQKYIRYGNEFYHSTAGYYQTTGTWALDAPYLSLLGDKVLRQELIALQGAGMVAGGIVMRRRAVSDLLAIETSFLQDGQPVMVGEYHAGTGIGGGLFFWRVGASQEQDGGFVLGSDPVGRWVRHARARRASQFGIHATMSPTYNGTQMLKLIASDCDVIIDCAFSLNPGITFEGIQNLRIKFEGEGRIVFLGDSNYLAYSLTFKYGKNIRIYDAAVEKVNHATSNAQYHIGFIGCDDCRLVGGELLGGGVAFMPDGNSTTDAVQFCRNAKVIGLNIINPRYGITMSNVLEYEISGCVIRNPRIYGAAQGDGSDGIKVTYGSGVSTGQIGTIPEKSGRGLITNNIIELEDTDDNDDCMDLYSGGHDLIVSNNVCVGGSEGVSIKIEGIVYEEHRRIMVSNMIFKRQRVRSIRATMEDATSRTDVIVNDIMCLDCQGLDEAVHLRGRGIMASNISISSDVAGAFHSGIRILGKDIHLSNFNVKNARFHGLAVAATDSTVSSGSITDCASESDAVYGRAGVRLSSNTRVKLIGVSVNNDAGGMTYAFHNRGASDVTLIGCSANVTVAPVAYSASDSAGLRLAESSLNQHANSWNPKQLEKTVSTTNATATSLLDYSMVGMPAGKYSVRAEVGAAGGAAGLFSKAGVFSWNGTTFDAPPLLTDGHADLKSDPGMAVVISTSSSILAIRLMVTGPTGLTVQWKGAVDVQRIA